MPHELTEAALVHLAFQFRPAMHRDRLMVEVLQREAADVFVVAVDHCASGRPLAHRQRGADRADQIGMGWFVAVLVRPAAGVTFSVEYWHLGYGFLTSRGLTPEVFSGRRSASTCRVRS